MAIRSLITRGFGNGTFNGTITEVMLRGYTTNPAVIVGGTFNIGEYFTTGGTVTIALYDPVTGDAIDLDSNVCVEIGSTGLFVWPLTSLTTQPTTYQEYGWVMTDGVASEGGIKVYNPINVDKDNYTEEFIVHSEWYN